MSDQLKAVHEAAVRWDEACQAAKGGPSVTSVQKGKAKWRVSDATEDLKDAIRCAARVI